MLRVLPIVLVLLCAVSFAQENYNMNKNTNVNVDKNQNQNQNKNQNLSRSNASFNESEVRQTASAIAPADFPTAPCRIATSIGGSSPFVGLSFGSSKEDKDCNAREEDRDVRETARAFEEIGMREAARQLLCSLKASQEIILNCNSMPLPGDTSGVIIGSAEPTSKHVESWSDRVYADAQTSNVNVSGTVRFITSADENIPLATGTAPITLTPFVSKKKVAKRSNNCPVVKEK